MGELPYYSASQFYRKRFGEKVYKISIDGGFTCPNRDGTIGADGCIYCVNEAFSRNSRGRLASISEQLRQGIEARRRGKIGPKFIAYFQAYSNTYDSIERLKERYDEILGFSEIVGLSIGTRPDCITEEKLSLIGQYRPKYEVWLEYGLQSAKAETLRTINRGHDLGAFEKAVQLTRQIGIPVCVHVILGLPGEDAADYINTAKYLSTLPIQGIKIHHLQVLKETALAQLYQNGNYTPLSIEAYCFAVVDFLERTSPTVVIYRLMTDSPADMVLAPKWNQKKTEVLEQIRLEFAKRGTCQGYYCR